MPSLLKTNIYILGLIGLGSFLSACQGRHFEEQKWQLSDGPMPAWAKQIRTPKDKKPIQIGAQSLFIERQQVGDIPVEGAFRKQIFEDGQMVWIVQNSAPSPLNPLQQAKAIAAKFTIERNQRQIEQNLKIENFHLDLPLKIVIAKIGAGFTPVFTAEVSQRKTGQFFKDTYTLSGERIKRERVGSALNDETESQALQAQLFPLGPKKSLLEWVDLTVLKNPTTFGNAKVSITSQSGNDVRINASALNYNLDDPRFDQVQVYYFVDRFLNQLKARHGFELPAPLSIETHIGYPDKTNAAFYHRSIIRFGSGDGAVFQDLMRDPTVVTHEVGHAVIDALTELPFTGEGGSLNEGFADFFAGSILSTPLMGESSYVKAPYRRKIDNSKMYSDRVGKMYADSEIVSGLFWNLRTAVGAEKAELLALKVLAHLLPSAGFEQLKVEVLEQTKSFAESDQLKILHIMSARRWQ